MMRRFSEFDAFTLVVLAAGAASAHPPAGRPQAAALRQLLQTMQGFTAALGVECSHRRVREGAGGRTVIASDEKPPKRTARAMMLAVGDLNAKIPAAANKRPEASARVGCVTCHRGGTVKPDEALEWPELNLEFNPRSARPHSAMAQIYNRKRDTPNAIESVQKALEIHPANEMAKMLLETLRT
jgi:hypothetical protein